MRQTIRRAVTLIEVVFSIGVILIGLLGLLSILPLAGNRAQDSIALSVGPSMGIQVIDRLETQRYLSTGRLSTIPATTGDVSSTLVASPTTPSFCIDPMFASSTNLPANAIANGYTAAVFPYYKATHNPMADPSTLATMAAQPRMTRVGITRLNNPAQWITVPGALEIAENPDDLLVTRPEDRTLYATLKDGLLEAVTGGLEYGKRIPSGDFTWIATVNPLPGGVYASVSVVVIKKRTRAFDTPTATTAPESPQGNGIGERVAYVTYASGFSGGAGGVVHLVSNANTVSRIRSGDWVMLSRNVNPAAGGPVYHRWYRVVAVDGKAEEFTTNGDPSTDDANLRAKIFGGPHDVWRHKVLLDGPDWAFDFRDVIPNLPNPPNIIPRDYADNVPEDNTYATIVEGVVSVTERVVLLSDL